MKSVEQNRLSSDDWGPLHHVLYRRL